MLESGHTTIQQLVGDMRRRLDPLTGADEARAIIRLIFSHLKGWSQTDLFANGDRPASEFLISEIDAIINRIERHEPVQYILGLARFYGMDLNVDRRVLIPRPETEEMVDMIVAEEKDRTDLRVLDIGTGSGAIAIALSRNLRFPCVTALDFSEGALEVARTNAERLHAPVKFIKADIFKYEPEPESFDLIVSNPPYIPEEEKKDMERNVLDYEPHSALFVPDSSPLLFYSRIATVAARGLAPGGSIWLEINPRFADNLAELLKEEGFYGIEIHQDISHRQRFISACI